MLKIRWIHSELLVYSNGTSAGLFFPKDEVGVLKSNYNLAEIQFAENSRLILVKNKMLRRDERSGS